MVKIEESEKGYDPNILPDLLPVYYKRLFPHKPFYRWLSYGNSENGIFTHREISFTLADDVYIRYLSFDNQPELEKEICSRNPHKIDIGAVLSVRPKHHRATANIHALQRELVFDIDMTDYDEVRNCCEGANVCTKCWKFMTIACRVLDAALREDFGFEHILWVFSGRRGIHCWVCDKTARHLDNRGRGAVADYLNLLIHGGENSTTKASIGERLHHSVRRALKIVEPMFEEVCIVDQDMFGNSKGVTKLVQMLPDENLRKDFEAHLKNVGSTSKEVWEAFLRFCNAQRSKGNAVRRMKNIVEEVQLAFLYPRLDINVTKGLNHLLKAPFCVHPKTGKICVPFNPSAAAKFDPMSVPTITALLEEINAFDDKIRSEDAEEDKNRIKDYKKTGMFKGVVVFEEFLRKLESSFKGKAIEVSDSKMEF